MQLVTPTQLQKIAPTLKLPQAQQISDLLNELCTTYGITDTEVFKMFLANVIQESGEFAHKEENMYYHAKTLVKVWPGRFKTIEAATPYAKNPEKLANKVYGGRLGNTEPGDGFQFKGGGFIGLTGREVYTKYATFVNKDVKMASDLIRTDNRYALDSACWFFAVLKKLIPVAMTGNFINVVKGINGGTIGLPVRQQYYAKTKEVIT